MKSLLIGALFLFPTLVFAQAATFQNNLSYGSTGSDVSALQEFLVTQHVLAPQYVTGNFYSLTLVAVKSFQTAESISPVSGFVGPITRETINTILGSEASTSEGNAATSTLPFDLSQSTSTVPTQTNQWYTSPIQQTPNVTPPMDQTQNTTPVAPVRNPPTVTIANVGASQTVSAGSSGVNFAPIQLAVSTGDENIRVSAIPLVLSLSNGAQASDLSGCVLMNESQFFTTGPKVINPGFINPSGGRFMFYLDNSLTINANTVLSLNLLCTVSPLAVDGATYQWSVDTTYPTWASGTTWSDGMSTNFQGQGSITKVSNPLQAANAIETAQFNQSQDCINQHTTNIANSSDKSLMMEQAILACQ